ncbi:MAG: Tm-1-like ATP-binding domain-containing protein [Bacillota bacterium]
MRRDAGGKPGVLIMGILDTKGDEVRFLRDQVERAGGAPIVMELTVSGKAAGWADISIDEVAREAGVAAGALTGMPREKAADLVAKGATAIASRLVQEGRVGAVMGFAGSLGTSICTRVMQELPYGIAKLMLSTMASGDCRPYVDIKDIAMWYPVAEKGLNSVTVRILSAAAGAAVGAASAPEPAIATRPLIGYTMFGTTTPCVEVVRGYFEERGYDSMVVHAVGSGGRSMEEMTRSGFIAGMADVTTHELTDMVCGGVLSAGPGRLTAAGERGVPQVISTGGADMINFGPREHVVGKASLVTGRTFEEEEKLYPGRTIYRHNPMVTVIGTLPEEARALARAIAERLNRARGPTCVAVPMRGWSAYDIREPDLSLGWAGPGPGPFWDGGDPERPTWSKRSVAFLDELKEQVDLSRDNLEVLVADRHINEREFGLLLARILDDMLGGRWRKRMYGDLLPWVSPLQGC